MNIVTVYPLAKGMRAEKLNYYSPHPLSAGTIVSIPIQSRSEYGVVADSTPANENRSQIRSADYELKPINHAGNQLLLPEFISAAKKFAAFCAATTGATIRSLTPQPVISSDNTQAVNGQISVPDISAPPTSIIQAADSQQLSYIESLTAKCSEAKKSVFVCVPTVRDCHKVANHLSAYNPVILHGSLKKTEQQERWNKVIKSEQSSVIIGTAPFLSIPITDLNHIIVYNESDGAFKMKRRPYIKKELFARYLARELRISCTVSDAVLPAETLWQFENNNITEQFPPDFRRTDQKNTQLIDMSETKRKNSSGVQLFAPQTARLIRNAEQGNAHIFLFVARRGRRPFTICDDCGEVLQCSRCKLPLLLTEENNQRFFVCQTCDYKTSGNTRCDNCNSWRLEPLGIGVDFVADVLEEQTSGVPIYQLDSNNASSVQKEQQIMKQFYEDASGILIGTKLGIHNLNLPVDSSAVITADALLAVPDLHVSHDLFTLLMALRDKTTNEFIIQTRSQNTDILKAALSGDIRTFYEQEIQQREKFNYPPFSYLIKLSVPENSSENSLISEISKQFSDYQLQTYPARESNIKAHILIRVKRSDWIDKQLLTQLRNLPLNISINAHPRSLL